jgi:hypothetical protein
MSASVRPWGCGLAAVTLAGTAATVRSNMAMQRHISLNGRRPALVASSEARECRLTFSLELFEALDFISRLQIARERKCCHGVVKVG